jgi:hypothetical protein
VTPCDPNLEKGTGDSGANLGALVLSSCEEVRGLDMDFVDSQTLTDSSTRVAAEVVEGQPAPEGV